MDDSEELPLISKKFFMQQVTAFQLTNVYSLDEKRRLPLMEVNYLAEKEEEQYRALVQKEVEKIVKLNFTWHIIKLSQDWEIGFIQRKTSFEIELPKKES